MVRFSFREVARKMFCYILAVLLFLLLIPVLWSFSPARLQPRQPHEPTSQTFGIGFDLATSYGCVDLLLHWTLANCRLGLSLSRTRTGLCGQLPKSKAILRTWK
jgi:hypothetical protein